MDLNAEQTRCSDVSRVCEKCTLGAAVLRQRKKLPVSVVSVSKIGSAGGSMHSEERIFETGEIIEAGGSNDDRRHVMK